MFPRIRKTRTFDLLGQFPAVALLGPRQVGKTTLALEIAEETGALYLDLERPGDLAKLTDPADYLSRHRDKLVILDDLWISSSCGVSNPGARTPPNAS